MESPPSPAAASCIGGHRFSRPRRLDEYCQYLEQLESEGLGKATGSDDYHRETTYEQKLLDR